ncbi:hypothetical protein PR003_g29400 [Phytophthora rubi]|uniref:Uncharacterized protein n=1 Tax=Phytophthora rubi TaxID=129364 RepID=A0A6A4BNJ1_9STRA|nr:hypothetical protein PR001_g28273 [Phytophthora rubi]KAE9275208.1 hypothetical protein PR003_g29400 [Phytophthora rubi]
MLCPSRPNITAMCATCSQLTLPMLACHFVRPLSASTSVESRFACAVSDLSL